MLPNPFAKGFVKSLSYKLFYIFVNAFVINIIFSIKNVDLYELVLLKKDSYWPGFGFCKLIFAPFLTSTLVISST